MNQQSQPQVKSSAGQGMIEYVLIIVLIALFLIAAFTLLSGGMSNVLNDLIEFL
jgi:Flp pilus assembly pilin Flp